MELFGAFIEELEALKGPKVFQFGGREVTMKTEAEELSERPNIRLPKPATRIFVSFNEIEVDGTLRDSASAMYIPPYEKREEATGEWSAEPHALFITVKGRAMVEFGRGSFSATHPSVVLISELMSASNENPVDHSKGIAERARALVGKNL